jgi:hypothetical protein
MDRGRRQCRDLGGSGRGDGAASENGVDPRRGRRPGKRFLIRRGPVKPEKLQKNLPFRKSRNFGIKLKILDDQQNM